MLVKPKNKSVQKNSKSRFKTKFKPKIQKNNKAYYLNAIANALEALNNTKHVHKNNNVPNHPGPKTVLSAYKEVQLVGYYHLDLSFHIPQALLEHSLTPNHIWNMDETGFVLFPKIQKVISTKSTCQIHKVLHSNMTDHISVAPTISASGLLEEALADSVMGFTESGYMKEHLYKIYLKHFINSIPPIRLVLLMLNGHTSYINYLYVNFCHENEILLYVLPPYTTHILQLSEISFAKLKNEYNKKYDKLYRKRGELVTKHTFAKVLGPAFAATYTTMAITNAYKAIGIWPFNPNAITPDWLDPSLVTEIYLPISQQIHQTNNNIPPVSELLQSTNTYFSLEEEVASLRKEVKLLKDETSSLKKNYSFIQEELEIFKNLDTYVESETKDSSVQPQKKRKTLLFAQLLTHEESLKELKEANKLAKKKAKAAKQKKEEAIHKKEVAIHKKEMAICEKEAKKQSVNEKSKTKKRTKKQSEVT
ncbi:3446_t:CDS:2 [Cetraspora pellucida]|uniref:3446_t:CDS:1 n=1 Tax=Cetraspora pellucida TaxID=1433469 RepID=A0A9N9E9Q0_9GLOM|nr:3446_t:CDS:2 [Cetraspora pellucida]